MKSIYSGSDPEKFPAGHHLTRESLDCEALKVLQRLRQFQHTAYFVGGCVRDLLLGRKPKDFDVVTSARPKQVRRIFRNSRIIGKRFLLVHVVFGQKIVEVATFRRAPDSNSEESLLIKDDNFFGTDEQDVLRRDFTINALFYNPHNDTLIDYVGGLEDIRNRQIRTIGDANIRFQEDPIRILRALKLAARLHFSIVPEVKQAILRYAPTLSQAAPERLLLEILKILQGGASLDSFHQLAANDVLATTMPQIYEIWSKPSHISYRLLQQLLQRLDKISPESRNTLKETTLLAVLCFPVVFFQNHQRPTVENLDVFCKTQLYSFASSLSIPKSFLATVVKIICAQFYFEKYHGNVEKGHRILRKEYFGEALDFLHIRTYNDPKMQNIYQFWHQCHNSHSSHRSRRMA